ncbi:sigma-54-dependent transcriptional regulator [Oceanidesulfovibrio marinus]|uniref:Sigma-54-dependent Fis family transcriptional regulator n=1 Tax=Oceanidesulfovibrio marinus TaxID=370038 RepID=A0A6P1ZGN0_9BACT|nr:sigma-54 dependent transcriptional regulator [Oceanidesulfovibrio marinus]TVM33430.1 sigma-54-dependent Fis family transcriptional regulator [Oceanidesulfovibrio marinus]
MAKALCIDDTVLCRSLETAMGHSDVEMRIVQSLAAAREALYDEPQDVVILGCIPPGPAGLECLNEIRRTPGRPEVLLLTDHGDPEFAEIAIRSGAWSYMIKPPVTGDLVKAVLRALDHREERRTRRKPVALKRNGILGDSEALRRCLDQLAQAAVSDSSVLISGETGTGKELFATAIHENSPRSSGAFVVVDCAAMPEALVESMLFGHEKGAYTSADSRAEGLVTQAHKGTLFLDEVGELPLAIQKSFLRVLEGHTYRPVGGAIERISDFRLVSATNRDLEAMVLNGTFRKDLLFRLRAINIELPPLRNSVDDINELTCNFIGRVCDRMGISRKGFSTDFLEALEKYEWPGNVRELINTIEYAIAAAGDAPALFPRHLPTHIRARLARHSVMEQVRPEEPAPHKQSLDPENFPDIREFRDKAMADLEVMYLGDLMELTQGDIPRACEVSGLSRARLYALLKKYGLSKEREQVS